MVHSFASLLLSMYFATCALQGVIQAFDFLKEPTDTNVAEGEQVILACSVNDASASVQWFKEQMKIKQDFVRVTILADNSLRILEVRKDDSGSYYCKATKDGTSIQSRTVTLTIQYICDDNFKIKSPGVVFRGGHLSLTCDCPGVPAPSYTWTRDGKPVDFKTGRIEISNAPVNSSGSYKCFANNLVKNVSSVPYDLSVIDGAPPRIILPPKAELTFVLKGEAMLNCLSAGDPAPTVSWYFKNSNNSLRNTSLLHVFPNGSLHFQEVHKNDAGKYKCIARNAYDTSKTYTSRLIQASIGKVPAVGDQIVAIGGALSVECKPPKATPKVSNIEWKLGNGSNLPNNERIKVEGNKLKINNIVKSDSGIYQCVARNIAGERRLNVSVIVAIYPKVTQNPQNQTVIEGKTTRMECKFSGDPRPTISWEKDGQDLPTNSAHYKISGSSLTIETVEPNDNGFYRCSARLGGVTERSKAALLKILEIITIQRSDNVKVDIGETAKLECKVKGEKPWNITWAKVGLPGKLLPHMKPNGHILHIESSTLGDTGNYTCTAKNSFSTASSAILVNVYKYPVFVIRPENVTVKANGNALFHCNMTGYPKPTTMWYKKVGKKLNRLKEDDRVKLFNNGSLLLVNVRLNDSMGYSCVGGNAGSLKEATAYLKIESLNGVPVNDKDDMGQTIGIAVGCAGAYIILVVGLMIYCRGRRARRSKTKLVVNGDLGEEEVPLNSCESAPAMKAPDAKYQYPRKDLETLRTLGGSSYGNVFLAQASEIVEGERTSVVVVQSLTTKDEKIKREFTKTMEMLSLKHENIAKLLGVCREEEPMYLISEYPEQGDLKTVMRDSSTPLNPTQKVNICAAVASGMNYLTNHGHVHKDLAARNCLVDKTFNVKISFLSLNQGTYPKEYYRRNGELIPLRWMSPEAMKGQFDDMSDVWSFGILMWEVYTEGLLPYEERSDNEVLKSVPYDLRLTKPERCPGKVFKLMEQCWEEESEDRPTFGQLCEEFSEIPRDNDF